MTSDMPGDSPAAQNLIKLEDHRRGGRGGGSGSGGGVSTELREMPLSDVWGAKWFAHKWRSVTRYSYELKKWLVYLNGRWAVDIWGEHDRRLVASFERLSEAPQTEALLIGKEPSALREFAFKCLQHRTLTAITARAHCEMAVTANEFDNGRMILPLKNCTIDLTTGETRAPRPEDMCMKQCPVDFDADAVPERWLHSLGVWMAGDEKMIAYLRRVVASFLTGDVGDESFFMLLGPTRTGKGTFVSTIEALLGTDYAFAIPVEYFLKQRGLQASHQVEVHAARAKRLITVTENEKNAKFDNQKIKRWTGGDAMSGRGLHENLSSYLPTHKLLLQTNHEPQFEQMLSERLKTISFRVQLSENQRDPKLKDYLRENELPGVLNWALGPLRDEVPKEGETVGLREWLVKRLATPEAVKQATRDVLDAQFELKEFFEDRCDVGDANFELRRDEGYLAYRKHCDETGERHPLGKKAFFSAMREYPGIEEAVSGHRNWRGWRGIKMRDGASHRQCERCALPAVKDGRCERHPIDSETAEGDPLFS